jgi:lipid II isoglutaminyl synthase (glutamine-hydrolysing)
MPKGWPHMKLVNLGAVLAGKAALLAARSLRLGGGTNLPGVVARKLAPGILRSLTSALPAGTALVSGTNGKTTTTRMIAEIVRASGRSVLHNRAGANLITGLTATAIAESDWRGHNRAQLGLFETDEAALPQAVAETNPRLVLIHNLFRDQLDRYGEVDTIANQWRTALAKLDAKSSLVLNADDPAVAYLGHDLAANVVYYGLEDARHASGNAAHTADSQFCRRCGQRYHYSQLYYAHIGHYRCTNCGHQRPQTHVRLERLDLHGISGSTLFVTYPGGAVEVHLPLPGIYNAINALAAIASTLQLDCTAQQQRAALEQFSAAFGRIERVQAGPNGPPMLITLIKNPVGASETVRMLTQSLEAEQSTKNEEQRTSFAVEADSQFSVLSSQFSVLYTLIIINDRHADGTDVSWLWDADFEQLAPYVGSAIISGTRGTDMAVRLKYAGVDQARIQLVPAIPAALDSALASLPSGATLFILPTYTAMLELRDELARRRWVHHFWAD